MHPKNNSTTQNHYVDGGGGSGVPYATNNNTNNYTENHCYQQQHPASMVYDTSSSYAANYKDEGEILHDMYPTMSMMSGGNVIENDMTSNGEYNNEHSYYQQRACNTMTNCEGNGTTAAGHHPSHFSHSNNGLHSHHSHMNDAGEPNHLTNNYSNNRKRNVNPTTNNVNPMAYGYNPHDLKQHKNDKASKGLRHFSMKVCEKVQQKKITTYNEVADELVNEFGETDKGPGNEQNIRRRVYDALNVLMAMNIISKDKKEIRWLGLPSNSAQEHQRLRNEGTEMYESIKSKLKTIYELIVQQVSLQNLISYNKKLENEMGCKVSSDKCIQLPFLAITTSQDTDVVCRINDQKNKYDISFSSDFELNDDSEILKRLGFSCNLDNPNCTVKDLNRSLQLVPPNLSYYVRAMAGRSITEFQEHILSNRAYLSDDDVMEFYNRINKTIFETVVAANDTPTNNYPSNQHHNVMVVDKLNSNSVGHYTYNHNSTFPDHSPSNSNNDTDLAHHPFNQHQTTHENGAYSMSSPPTTTAHPASPNSNEESNDAIHLHHNSNETFVRADHNFTHMTSDNDLSPESINTALNHQPGHDKL